MSRAQESISGTELGRLQQWMQTVITHPSGVRAALASADSSGGLHVNQDALEAVVLPSATLSGIERLAIYGRSYQARLVQCFQSMFPALRKALGEELFDEFALDYLSGHPPSGYTLDRLADAFPQHLAETRPDADAPPDERESWPDFIIELAQLELVFLKVYDGPGVEGLKLPGEPDIRALSHRRVMRTRLAPAPCLRLFAFRYPVHTYMLAARGDECPVLPTPLESFVAMTRVDYRVRLHELSAQQYEFLKALEGGQPIALILKTCSHEAASSRPSVTVLHDWLCEWAGEGFFESIEDR